MKNTSGIKPVEYKVLIKPEAVEKKSAGGIYIPEQVQDKEKYAKERGIIIAVSPNAFTDPDWIDKPEIGDKVIYDRYAGALVKGNDGEDYRLINDKEIGAVLEV